ANGYAADLAVPIWGAFMKTATRADKPDWFERPANVVGVNVCRVSGKLPNSGCGGVVNVNDDGSFETKSMIYTDYFVKGTQPTTICPLHQSNAIIVGDAAAAPVPPGMPHPQGALGTAGTAGLAIPEPPGVSGGTVQGTQPDDKDKDKADQGKKKRGF